MINGSMSDKPEVVCDECGKSFGRQSQLTRHALTHSQERRYGCSECDKRFLRRDALVRHEQVHQPHMGPNLLQRGARACLNCAAAKARCSGELPCARCTQRSMQCRYNENIATPSSRQLPQIVPNEDTSYDALLHPGNHFETQYSSTDRLTNINWLSTPMMNSADNSGSLDTLPWLFNDTELWTDLHNLPFGISPLPNLSEGFAARRPSVTFQETSTVSTESPTTSTALSNEEAGRYYVDGSDSRLPHVKRRKLSRKSGPKTATPVEINFSLSTDSHDESEEHCSITEHAYHSIRNAYEATCVKIIGPCWTVFGVGQSLNPFPNHSLSSLDSSNTFASEFPPKEVFDHLLSLYMEHFQPIMPLFQPSRLPSSWQVLFAMCVLGSHFGGKYSDRFVVSILEVLRRVLHVAADDPSWLPVAQLETVQVRLLHSIGMLFCGDERMSDFGLSLRIQPSHVEGLWKIANQVYHDWGTWCSVEAAKRTSYAVWLLDCMMMFHFQQKPLLQLEHADTILPCHQKVWDASDAEEWQACLSRYPSPPSLTGALQQLYVEKKLAQDIDDFSRVLIVHGIFHRTWEVGNYYQQPLSRWSPSAQKNPNEDLSSKSPIWLPSIPTFAKWRNSACDCIDIMHWSANAAIGAAAGMEPSYVMHLHLARVVLLTPHKHIVSLARYLAGESPSHTSENAALDRQVIRRWATQDQYKARLAMIHAGVIFWHIRRFSANGFYEPTSVALSVLALWAFSAFSARPVAATNSREKDREVDGDDSSVIRDTDSSQEEEEERYDIILLDRPTDDELVQQFVRRGHLMQANINGVGNLYSTQGSERVLVEGRKLLATLNCWGIKENWMRMLGKLITVTRHERKNTAGL